MKLPSARRRRAKASHPPELRESLRHACGPEVSCRLYAGADLDCPALRVHNLSAGGVSLLVDRVIPSGKLLVIEIRNEASGISCRRPVRVVYTLQLPTGGLTMGAAFCPPLAVRDVDDLLGRADRGPETASPAPSSPSPGVE
jgi:hypothetical protein